MKTIETNSSFSPAQIFSSALSARETKILVRAVFTAFLLLQVTARANSTAGAWSALQNWPIVAVHSHLLPTGKVLFWPYSDDIRLWDPATSQISTAPLAGRNVFCSGHAFLADGKLIVPGGHIRNNFGLDSTGIYDPVNNNWNNNVPAMNAGRWYPSATTLANGDVLVTSGDANRKNNTLPQVYQAANNSWRGLTSAQLQLPLYPRTFLAPNGRVFFATSTSRYLDTAGTGAWTTVGNTRVSGRDNYGSACMYSPGKIIWVGGGDPPTATCEVIDLNQASPAWRLVGSMASPRRQNNVTILPDGKVLATGGSSGRGFNDDTSPVLTAEMWDPATESWTTMASHDPTVYRGYHSTALLLPDGRVLSAGGDNEPNAQVYSPPYLFKGARPTISSSPASVTYGQTFTVGTPEASSITQVTLTRLSSATHAQNWDQRINFLSFTQGSGALSATSPASANVCPPGYYLLWIINSTGVPSVSALIRIG